MKNYSVSEIFSKADGLYGPFSEEVRIASLLFFFVTPLPLSEKHNGY